MQITLSPSMSEKVQAHAKRLDKTPDEIVEQVLEFHFMHAKVIHQTLSAALRVVLKCETGVNDA